MPNSIHTTALHEVIDRRIHVVRGAKVMLGSDLALLYQVPPRVLVQAVKRKIERFPADFMFQLTPREFRNLKSQNGTSSWSGTRKPPYAFTGKGVVMLSGVLRCQRAISVSIEIMRSFVCSRCVPDPHEELARRLSSLEENQDPRFKIVFDVIAEMMIPPERGRIMKQWINADKDKELIS